MPQMNGTDTYSFSNATHSTNLSWRKGEGEKAMVHLRTRHPVVLSMEVIHKSEKRGILRSFELKKMLRSLEKMRTHPP